MPHILQVMANVFYHCLHFFIIGRFTKMSLSQYLNVLGHGWSLVTLVWNFVEFELLCYYCPVVISVPMTRCTIKLNLCVIQSSDSGSSGIVNNSAKFSWTLLIWFDVRDEPSTGGDYFFLLSVFCTNFVSCMISWKKVNRCIILKLLEIKLESSLLSTVNLCKGKLVLRLSGIVPNRYHALRANRRVFVFQRLTL